MTMRMPTDCTVRYSDVCVVLYRYCRATWAGGNSCGRSRNTGTGLTFGTDRSYVWHRGLGGPNLRPRS